MLFCFYHLTAGCLHKEDENVDMKKDRDRNDQFYLDPDIITISTAHLLFHSYTCAFKQNIRLYKILNWFLKLTITVCLSAHL